MLKRTLTGMTMLLAGTSVATADPFNPKAVPADAKWVVHIDVDAVAKSKVWDIIEQRLSEKPEAQAKLQEMEMVTGMSFPQDLHSVTVYGLGFGDADGVILAKATANQQQLLNMLQMNPSYASFKHGEHEIVAWEDKGKVMHGSFFSADTVIMAQSQENVEKALDTLDAKTPTIDPSSAMSQPTGAGVLAGVASDAISYLAQKDKNNPVLKNVKTAWITLSQQGDDVALRGQFDCGSDKVAQQMKTMAEGLKAAGSVFAANENADAKLKAIAPLLNGVAITQEGQKVLIVWTAAFDQAKSAFEQLQAAKGK